MNSINQIFSYSQPSFRLNYWWVISDGDRQWHQFNWLTDMLNRDRRRKKTKNLIIPNEISLTIEQTQSCLTNATTFSYFIHATSKLVHVAIYKIFNDSKRLDGFIIFKLSYLHFMKENFVQRFPVFIKFRKQKYHNHIYDRSLTHSVETSEETFLQRKKNNKVACKSNAFHLILYKQKKNKQTELFGEKISFSIRELMVWVINLKTLEWSDIPLFFQNDQSSVVHKTRKPEPGNHYKNIIRIRLLSAWFLFSV